MPKIVPSFLTRDTTTGKASAVATVFIILLAIAIGGGILLMFVGWMIGLIGRTVTYLRTHQWTKEEIYFTVGIFGFWMLHASVNSITDKISDVLHEIKLAKENNRMMMKDLERVSEIINEMSNDLLRIRRLADEEKHEHDIRRDLNF